MRHTMYAVRIIEIFYRAVSFCITPHGDVVDDGAVSSRRLHTMDIVHIILYCIVSNRIAPYRKFRKLVSLMTVMFHPVDPSRDVCCNWHQHPINRAINGIVIKVFQFQVLAR